MGEFVDDSVFGYIVCVDKDDDLLEDESCWVKVLLVFGIIYFIENVCKLVVIVK